MKQLTTSTGLPGEFARAFLSSLNPAEPNRQAIQQLADRTLDSRLERPVDALTFGLMVAVTANQEQLGEAGNELDYRDSRLLSMIRALHRKLPARPASHIDAQLIRLFRSQGVQLAAARYVVGLTAGETLLDRLATALADGVVVNDRTEFRLDELYTELQRAIDAAVEDSRLGDSPIVHAAVVAELQNLAGQAMHRTAEEFFNHLPEDADVDRVRALAEQLQLEESRRRAERFAAVMQALGEAVELVESPSDIAMIDALVADPTHYQFALPVGDDDPGETVRAVMRLTAIQSQLRMRGIADRIRPLAKSP